MEILKIENVQISPKSIRAVLKALDKAIAKHTEMKQLIEHLLVVQENGGREGVVLARGPGRPIIPGRRGRRLRGEKTLREAIVDVLKANRGPLKPVELRDKVLESGYLTTATAQSFYTAVFNTARNEPSVAKTPGGFQLKKSAAQAGKKSSKKAKNHKSRKKTRARN